jgi:hypothetical protein
MKYCPYCAEPLTKPTKICPHCKKSLDFDLIKELLESSETSQLNKKLQMKLWFKERSYIFYPIITLIIGFIIGGVILYGVAQGQFVAERKDYKNKIAGLQQTIETKDAKAGDVQSDLQSKLARKDRIIQTLLEQKDIYSRLIYFTNRLSTASTITPNSEEDADYYRRNTLYLVRLFEEAQKKLDEAKFKDDKNYHLQSIPALIQ